MLEAWVSDLLDDPTETIPAAPSYATDLRTTLEREWRGEQTARTGSTALAPGGPPRRRLWAIVAASLLIVGTWAVAVLQPGRSVRLATAPSPTATDATAATDAPTTTTAVAPSATAEDPVTSAAPAPLDEIPAGAIGVRWVVTAVNGEALSRTDLPWYEIGGDERLTGWDGCNFYDVLPERTPGTSTVMECVAGATPIRVDGSEFVIDSATRLLAGDIVSESFDDATPPTSAQMAQAWTTPSGSTVVDFTGGHIAVGDCEPMGTWVLDGTLVVEGVDSTVFACAARDDAHVVEQLVEGGGRLMPRPDGSLWVSSEQFVTRLVPVADDPAPVAWDSNVRLVVAAPDGVRVLDRTGASRVADPAPRAVSMPDGLIVDAAATTADDIAAPGLVDVDLTTTRWLQAFTTVDGRRAVRVVTPEGTTDIAADGDLRLTFGGGRLIGQLDTPSGWRVVAYGLDGREPPGRSVSRASRGSRATVLACSPPRPTALSSAGSTATSSSRRTCSRASATRGATQFRRGSRSSSSTSRRPPRCSTVPSAARR